MKTYLKGGTHHKTNTPQANELDVERFIFDSLRRAGIQFNDPCCPNLNIAYREFADNTAAVAGGLKVNESYRTGDVQKVVHL